MLKITESSEYKSLKAEGAIFGGSAANMLSKKGTMRTEFVPIEVGDILVCPMEPVYGYTKRYGGFVLVHLLKGGDPKQASVYTLYPGTVVRTLFPVEKNEDGIYEQTGERPKNTGTLIKEIQKFGNYKEAFDNLKGKAIEVKDLQTFEVLRFGSTDETQERAVYELDIIEAKGKLKEFTEASVAEAW